MLPSLVNTHRPTADTLNNIGGTVSEIDNIDRSAAVRPSVELSPPSSFETKSPVTDIHVEWVRLTAGWVGRSALALVATTA